MSITAQQLDIAPQAMDTTELATFYKAAGDPLRLSVLRLLHHNDYGVLELCQLLDIKQPSMSHHLKVLASAGLVVTRRDGNSIYYRRASVAPDTQIEALQSNLFAAVDLLPIADSLQKRIDNIHEERSSASREFFQQNADRFHSNQDLIASYAQYGNSITEFLESADIKRESVLEVGPGEGDFLTDLSSRFKQVVALDNSAEMLSRAEDLATKNRLKNIQFVHGDTGSALKEKNLYDCITLNMVLHHTPDPAQIFSDLAQLLKESGVLMVTELCKHDQSWARKSCGDLWLGFEPEDLTRWATDAGLAEGESLFLTQRNGFQIQLRQFLNPDSF